MLKILTPPADGLVADITVGLGGHAKFFLAAAPNINLIAADRDPETLEIAKKNLSVFNNRVRFFQSRMSGMPSLIKDLQPDVVFADIGVSSYQLDTAERGFSFQSSGPLDMRMDRRQNLTAEIIVNDWEVEELTDIFYRYGEIPGSKRIARYIDVCRKKKRIETTDELSKIVKESSRKTRKKIHPATLVFQSLRIAVNDELNELKKMLEGMAEILKPGARIGVISFHSLEDRIVKRFFKKMMKGCICPPDFPVCRCGLMPSFSIITGRVVKASSGETARNPRVRSACFRAAEKI